MENLLPRGTGDDSDPNLGFPHFLEGVDPEAKCLDGSPALYYHRAGWGSGVNSWLLFHEGNGFCGDLDGCFNRAGSWAGSSKAESEKSRYNMTAQSFMFSLDSQMNPLLYNWNHVFLRYCDGGYMSGHREGEVPVSSNTQGLGPKSVKHMYFRGRVITDAGIVDLVRSRGMEAADRVVIAGCSSGAIRTFSHADYLVEKIKSEMRSFRLLEGKLNCSDDEEADFPPTHFAIFPDSGFYIDTDLYRNPKQFLVSPKGHNATALLNKRCVDAQPKDRGPETCLIGSVVAEHLDTPWFSSQSRFDWDQLDCEITDECAKDPICVNEYGGTVTKTMHDRLLTRPVRSHGALLDSCDRHCGNDPHSLPVGERTGKTVLQLFADWWTLNFDAKNSESRGGNIDGSGTEKVIFDSQESQKYPCDDCCAWRSSASTTDSEAPKPEKANYQTVLI
uniref:Pectin acetylesterase n=1 Tax=Chromera velia CCMP2878 TaxID=1169474 RepID=A0A0G4GUA8_9ALVE|eukprot:Cvel_5213.t1-p1 / transcript=Cvel_5213.t1 / gene=Cvel_5213 / organism=Chromera_velia_CCMP2878 / gene_product=Protein notum homolog, putative / transcript_product=Protein notum homolog, putative / location=Cvel_scaffold240:26993-28327(-) / protein_length=445 / sequence_SO=supercontig / SO=protein_coding / is_pseudo=false